MKESDLPFPYKFDGQGNSRRGWIGNCGDDWKVGMAEMDGPVDRAYLVSVEDLRDICDALNDEKKVEIEPKVMNLVNHRMLESALMGDSVEVRVRRLGQIRDHGRQDDRQLVTLSLP